ncbi:MAG: gamma-glutamyl phosphate reductase [Rhodomicrobium sp.]|nr:MAG: gamma-glutamyl phosphate reductase [Rhodomicrobium sp.]
MNLQGNTAAPLKDDATVTEIMAHIGQNAKAAARLLAIATTAQKNQALLAMATELESNIPAILSANAIDVSNAREAGRDAAFIDRLELSEDRIMSIASGLKAIAELDDPVGHVIAHWQRPNGLDISRIQVPLGVIGIIYESRPNVTADAGGLCLKAGNAAILRGGSDSFHSSRAIHEALCRGLKAADLPIEAIQLVPTTDRAAVGEMLKGLNHTVDVIVPRGGKSLVARVEEEARVPVFSHLEGICHVYVDKSADETKAVEIVVNSKLRRTGICGAAETLLIDEALDETTRQAVITGLLERGATIRGDETIAALDARIEPANEEDWDTEYLDKIISAKLVPGIKGAIDHIAEHSSNHTEAIIAEDQSAVDQFFQSVDSAILLHNASTQFADGGEFGMGAEIGIATGKMHARGPVGVDQLTSFKYIVRGSGQIRPT